MNFQNTYVHSSLIPDWDSLKCQKCEYITNNLIETNCGRLFCTPCYQKYPMHSNATTCRNPKSLIRIIEKYCY